MLRKKGLYFEHAAERYLVARGMRVRERNYNCRVGEIDLIMEEGRTVVFVEVRFRESASYGSPLETITPTKQAKIVRAASNYLLRNPQLSERACRFDAIGITGSAQPLDICWIKGAFSA